MHTTNIILPGFEQQVEERWPSAEGEFKALAGAATAFEVSGKCCCLCVSANMPELCNIPVLCRARVPLQKLLDI